MSIMKGTSIRSRQRWVEPKDIAEARAPISPRSKGFRRRFHVLLVNPLSVLRNRNSDGFCKGRSVACPSERNGHFSTLLHFYAYEHPIKSRGPRVTSHQSRPHGAHDERSYHS